MRKFQTYGPSVVVLVALTGALLLGPVVVERIHAADTVAVVTLAQQRIDDDDVLERINQATRSIAQAVEPSVVYIEATVHGPRGQIARSTGSGWIYNEQGYIVTNAHVIASMQTIHVQFFDGRLRQAQLIGLDPSTDVAVVKVSAPTTGGLIPIRRATDDPVFQGDRVFAFGSPFGFKFSMSEGIVSGLGRRAASGAGGFNNYTNYIQTDAAINPGNSGGPMVDIRGRVVGMNTAIITSPERSAARSSELTGLSGGIGFAIPLETIEAVVKQLINGGEVLKGYLGVRLEDPDDWTAELRQRYGLTEGFGVLVRSVEEGLPAASAGLRADDLIIRIDGKETPTSPVLRSEISNHTPGDYVAITVLRNGQEKDFRVRLAAAKYLPNGQLVRVRDRAQERKKNRPTGAKPF